VISGWCLEKTIESRFLNADLKNLQMTKNRGGQPKPWFEILRISYWYKEVIHRSGCTNRELDDQFAWVNESERLLSSASQPRMFELIQKKTQIPTGVDPSFRNMDQLLDAMELDPRFTGLKEIYESIFWSLLDKKVTDSQNILKQINLLMDEYGLVRLLPEEVIEKGQYPALINKYGAAYVFEKCLTKSTSSMSTVDCISFKWLLFLLNESSSNWGARQHLESELDREIDLFTYFWFSEKHFDYYQKIIASLLTTKVDISKYGVYPADMGSQAMWPIVTKDLIGKINGHFMETFTISVFR